jgi:hypothetical protein
VNASVTKNNTIFITWKYEVESCDERFVVYWSRKGPVATFKHHQKFINDKNLTFFEIKELGNKKVFRKVLKKVYLGDLKQLSKKLVHFIAMNIEYLNMIIPTLNFLASMHYMNSLSVF